MSYFYNFNLFSNLFLWIKIVVHSGKIKFQKGWCLGCLLTSVINYIIRIFQSPERRFWKETCQLVRYAQSLVKLSSFLYSSIYRNFGLKVWFPKKKCLTEWCLDLKCVNVSLLIITGYLQRTLLLRIWVILIVYFLVFLLSITKKVSEKFLLTFALHSLWHSY